MPTYIIKQAKGILASIVLTMIAGAAAPAATSAPACDRACLRSMLDTYLNAVIKHDAGTSILATSYRATENGAETRAGDGLWKTASGLGAIQRRYSDPATAQAAYNGVLQEGDKQDIVSVRVKVDAGRITEAEWIIARPGGTLFSLEGLDADQPPPEKPLPAAQRTDRFMMVALANGYFQGLQDHDGSLIPAEPTCMRVENGARTTFRKRAVGTPGEAATSPALSGAMPTAAQEGISGNCVAGLEIFKTMISETSLRRFPLVDEEQGVVMGTTLFRRPPQSPRLRNLLTEYFYVRKGKLTGIWATMYYLPPEAPNSTGWEITSK